MFLGGSVETDMEGEGEERGVVGGWRVGECGLDWALVLCELGDECVFPFAVREGYRVSYASFILLLA